MGLEDFRPPRTPESRTPYVLLLMFGIGIVMAAANAVWRFLLWLIG